MNAHTTTEELASQWQEALVLYRAYTAVAREFSIDYSPCAELENAGDAPAQQAVQQARNWFDAMDQQIHIHQLRQFLQTSSHADDEILRLLLVRHLQKHPHSSSDRDKVDFLLVQYFSHLAPARLEDVECDLAYVAQALEPVVGAVNFSIPDWLAPLEQVIESATACRALNDLFRAHVLEDGRKLKANSGEDYFAPIALVAFARFNFLIRRIFFRLMHDEINSIHDCLHELERRGIRVLDCRRAHFSRNEPVDRLRMICHSWKVMFHAEYSSGQPLKILTDLHVVVNEALARSESGSRANKPGASPQGQGNGAQARVTAVLSARAPELETAATPLHHQRED